MRVKNSIIFKDSLDKIETPSFFFCIVYKGGVKKELKVCNQQLLLKSFSEINFQENHLVPIYP